MAQGTGLRAQGEKINLRISPPLPAHRTPPLPPEPFSNKKGGVTAKINVLTGLSPGS
jgi:hypothetical protein